jgi:hypothetical protein
MIASFIELKAGDDFIVLQIDLKIPGALLAILAKPLSANEAII